MLIIEIQKVLFFFTERDKEIKNILDHANLEKESLTNDYERQKQSIAKKYEK